MLKAIEARERTKWMQELELFRKKAHRLCDNEITEAIKRGIDAGQKYIVFNMKDVIFEEIIAFVISILIDNGYKAQRIGNNKKIILISWEE